MTDNVKRLTVLALLSSLVLVSTMFLKIPTPTGYIHLGDGIIYAAALAFGPAVGASAGAVGSALADLLGGYGFWAPWTFAIKGIAGLIVGIIGRSPNGARRLIATLVASLFIVLGYALGTAVLYSPEAILGEVLGNIVQTGSGVVLGLTLSPFLKKALH